MGGSGSGAVKNVSTCGAKTRNGTPCAKAPMVGLTRCRMHGGASPVLADRHGLAVMRRGMGRLITPVDENDTEVDPFNGFVMEVRRTLGAIRFYEEQIAKLSTDDDDVDAAVWGTTKEVDQNSGEFAGTDITREARPNIWITEWRREREHLTELHKVWIAAKMDERRWNAEQRHFEELDEIVTAVVVGLGKDPRDPAVRDVVRRALAGLKGKTPMPQLSA